MDKDYEPGDDLDAEDEEEYEEVDENLSDEEEAAGEQETDEEEEVEDEDEGLKQYKRTESDDTVVLNEGQNKNQKGQPRRALRPRGRQPTYKPKVIALEGSSEVQFLGQNEKVDASVVKGGKKIGDVLKRKEGQMRSKDVAAIVTHKKFVKASDVESRNNDEDKKINTLIKKKKKDQMEQRQKDLQSFHEKYEVTFDQSVAVDGELSVEISKIDGDEQVFLTRESPGYDAFTTLLPVIIMGTFIRTLEEVLRSDMSLKSLCASPIDIHLGENHFFVLKMERSKNLTYYRSARIESIYPDAKKKRSRFWINVVSLKQLLSAFKLLVKEK